jgi:ABC-type dipeptide/oligopeptide/nickel transport system permease subunit
VTVALADALDTTARPLRWRFSRPPSFLIIVSFAVIGLVIICAVAGAWITPHDPAAQSPLLSVQPPSGEHLLGTDQLGRDILSRLIAGTRNALIGPICVAVLSTLLGLALGMTAGFRGGWVDTVIARTADILYCLPALLVAIVVVGLVNGTYAMTIAVLVFLTFPGDVRIFRSVTMVESRLPYVDAARTIGLSSTRTMVRHVLPNIVPTVVATFLLEFAGSLVGFSALAFLGLGVKDGGVDWGTILADGQEQLFTNPMMSLGPAILLILVAASVTIVGDWIHDRLSRKEDR